MSLTLTLERGGGEVSGSGTNIELDGTIAGGAIEAVEMYGDTEQTTYSGKNLAYPLPKNVPDEGITATYNAQTGEITLSGTAVRGYSIPFQTVDVSIPAGTYTIKQFGTLTHGRMGINFRRANGTQFAEYVVEAGTLTNTFTLTEAAAKIYLFTLYHAQDQTVEGTVKFQMEAGSTATSFEPYVGGTASPNPDYPQEVQTVTGRQVVNISDGDSQSQEYEINLGKNLFDNDNANIYNGWVNDSQVLKDNASTTCVYVRCEPNTTYTIQKTNSGTNNRFCVWTTSSQPANDVPVLNYVGTRSGDDNNSSYTITTNKSAKYLGVFFSGGSTTPSVADIEATIQIEKGSSATTYAPYFTPIELCKIGTYQDYIYKSGEDWYVHKETWNYTFDGSSDEQWIRSGQSTPTNFIAGMVNLQDFAMIGGNADSGYCNYFDFSTYLDDNKVILSGYQSGGYRFLLYRFPSGSTVTDLASFTTWLGNHHLKMVLVLSTPTDTQITNSALIAQLNALNEATTYDGTTIITVSSENLAGPLEIKASSNIAKTYTEVEIGSPFTIADVEGKSSNTTLDGNVYVDWAYNKKQYSFDLFNLTPQDYADIRAFYDYQFNNSAFPTITVPELNIDKLPVYMEISSRNIINQCLLTDKLTIKFRETVQP